MLLAYAVSFREQNLAAVSPLLEGSPYPVQAPRAHDTLAAVDLDLLTPAGALHVRIEPNVAEQPAFARTRSLAISHISSAGHAPLPHAAVFALRAFARHVAGRDRGVALRAPGGAAAAAASRRLPLAGAERSDSSWSRGLFDRRIEGLAPQRGSFLSAVLVVIQPCTMSCRFCPSGDRARAVPPDMEVGRHYDDLVYQLRAGRTLGATSVDIGGNDVLLFPRVVELFRAAGDAGYEHISAQSPGQRLADPDFAAAIAASPLDRIDMPIYGATAEEHEAVTRTPGSFDGLCRAVERALSLGRPRIELHTIALKSTLERVDALIDFGRRRFGLDVWVQLLRPNRVGEREHLEDAASPAEMAAVARRYPRLFEHDIPLCAMPFERAAEIFARRSSTRVFERRLHLWDLGLPDHSEDAAVKEERTAVFPRPCEACAMRAGCPGVLRAYLDRFGEGAFVPFQAASSNLSSPPETATGTGI